MSNDQTWRLADEADRYRQENRLVSWKADPATAESAASTLASSIGEHQGRWLYELLQNAEDAGSNRCDIRINGTLLTITDIGSDTGIPPQAVESLSNPFITTKLDAQSIGRKGIGFCSVYELTDEPFLWSRGSGIKFSKESTASWLKTVDGLERLVKSRRNLPYLHALVPFGLHALPQEVKIAQEETKGTIIGLPLKDEAFVHEIIDHFNSVDHRFLLTFQNLRKVTLQHDDEQIGEFRKSSGRNRPGSGITLRLLKKIGTNNTIRDRYAVSLKRVAPPEEILKKSAPSKRDRIRLKTVQVGIFTREDLGATLSPPKGPSSLFVYYPTEEIIHLGTIIHGDFILDASRKHLTDVTANSMNRWLLDQATTLLIETANCFVDQGELRRAISLFVLPLKTRADDLESLLPNFTKEVSKRFCLPNTDEEPRPLGNLIFIDEMIPGRKAAQELVSIAYPRLELAKKKLCKSDYRATINRYHAKWIGRESLLKLLKTPPDFESDKVRLEWCRHAWTWLAELKKSKGGDQFKLGDLAIIPDGNKLVSTDNTDCLPYLVPESSLASELPKWIQIYGLPSEFSRWIENEGGAIASLREKLGIRTYCEKSVVEAFCQAVSVHNPSAPGSAKNSDFLDFSRERHWPNHPELTTFDWTSVRLGDIPVPTTNPADGSSRWMKANSCYFGEGWDSPDLPKILSSNGEFGWVDPQLQKNWPQARRFLELCGVRSFPRLTEEGVKEDHRNAFWEKIKEGIDENQVTNRLHPDSENKGPKPRLESFKEVDPVSLDHSQSASLLRTLKAGWNVYYQSRAFIKLTYRKYSSCCQPIAPNVWLQILRDELRIAARSGKLIETGPLGKLWVVGPETPDWASVLFPLLEIDKNDPQATDFRQWILKTGLIRTRPEDIPAAEWVSEIFPALKSLLESADTTKRNDLSKIATYVYRGYLYASDGDTSLTNQPPRACWTQDGIRRAEDHEIVWAVSSDFEVRNWRDHLPVFQFRKADIAEKHFDVLGYRSLENALEKSLTDEFKHSEDEQKTMWLQQFLAWIFADRSNQLSERPSLKNWKKLRVSLAEEVRITLKIEGTSRTATVPYFFAEDHGLLILSPRAWKEPHIRASAITDALDLPSGYRNRIEILMGLDEQQRRNRFIEEEFVPSDIDSWLDEYRGNVDLPPLVEEPRPTSTSVNSPPVGTPAVLDVPPTKPEESPAESEPVLLHDPDTTPHFPEPETPVEAPPPRPPNSPPSPGSPPSKVPGNSAKRPTPPVNALDVEIASRAVVEKKLTALGYRVTQMVQENRGFDIEAKLNEETLIIEVKGNMDANFQVNFTPAELEIARNAGGSYRWQLWHVCRLAQRAGEAPEVRIYEDVPDEALRPDGYILDLKACTPIDIKGLIDKDTAVQSAPPGN